MANVIIMNLSELPTKYVPKEELYSGDGVKNIKGTNTADAPIKYLISLLKSKKDKIDKIITVVTKEAETSFMEFEKMLKMYTEEIQTELPEVIKISDTDEVETIKNVVSKIEKGDSLYIESTGGLRNTTYTLMTIVRLLEFSEIKLKKVVYSDRNSHKIKDITETYKMYNLINAVNSFTSYGNSSELNKFFNGSKNESIKKVISAMKDLSEDIMLCRTDLKKHLKTLNKSLKELESGSTNINEKDTALFISLVDIIRKKFYLTSGNNKIEEPNVIKWCLDNNFIQQAVTIYAERIPEYLYKMKFVVPSEDEEKRIESKKHQNKYYNDFFESFMRCFDRKAVNGNKITYKNEYLNTIEFLGETLDSTDRYDVKNCTIAEMQSIMRDYLYIKQYIRNKLNHANNEGEKKDIDERDNYLSNYGYDTKSELKADEIKKIVFEAVGRVINISKQAQI